MVLPMEKNGFVDHPSRIRDQGLKRAIFIAVEGPQADRVRPGTRGDAMQNLQQIPPFSVEQFCCPGLILGGPADRGMFRGLSSRDSKRVFGAFFSVRVFKSGIGARNGRFFL